MAEILSDRDKRIVDSKREICPAHPACTCIPLVRQDRAEVVVDRRTAEGWSSQVLQAADELRLPEFGFRRQVRYSTAIRRSAVPKPNPGRD